MYKHLVQQIVQQKVQQKVNNNYVGLLMKQFVLTKLVLKFSINFIVQHGVQFCAVLFKGMFIRKSMKCWYR